MKHVCSHCKGTRKTYILDCILVLAVYRCISIYIYIIYDILTCYPRLSTTVCTAEYSSHLSHLTAAISFKLKWHGSVSKTLRFAGTEEIIRNPKNLRKNTILKKIYMIIFDPQKNDRRSNLMDWKWIVAHIVAVNCFFKTNQKTQGTERQFLLLPMTLKSQTMVFFPLILWVIHQINAKKPKHQK